MAWDNIANLEERNKNQKKVYINLDNIDSLFDINKTDKQALCYDKIFNLCQKYITIYMKFTTNFELKKELAYSAICKLYIHFKKTLLKMQNANPEVKPELVFYLSQFYYYVHLTARNEVYMYHSRLKKSPQFIEFRNDVDYSQPIETYINSLEDIDSYIPVDEKIVLASNDYNINNKKTEDLESFDNETSFNQILEKVKCYFSEEEIIIIKDIYFGNMKISNKKLISIKQKLENNKELFKVLFESLGGI